jgi:ATP-dependent Clp protease ATP-binding subunit ClpA
MLNMNKFTLKSQEAIESAHNLAIECNHPQVEPEHFLLALVT